MVDKNYADARRGENVSSEISRDLTFPSITVSKQGRGMAWFNVNPMD